MATVIRLKRSETASDAPTASDLAVGEIAMNMADRLLYSKKTDGSIISIGAARLPESFTWSNDLDFGTLATATGDAYDWGDLTTASTAYDMGALITITNIQSDAPASATASGTKGDLTFDSDYMYVCVATNTWKRVALSSW
tara:strand:- start:514 stop:936 length:423 start_codon:yes stop_codon:yes gene_type:complete